MHLFSTCGVNWRRAAWAVVGLTLGGQAAAALQGRDLDGAAANGYEAFYDTVLNITWLADANYAKTTGYDADGAMDWDTAMSWAGGLTYFGASGWRLPHVELVNGMNEAGYLNGTSDHGFNITLPTNELSYMYYVNLGLKAALGPGIGDFDLTAGVNSNGVQPIPGLPGASITNLKANLYWSNVVFNETQKAWGLWTKFPVAGGFGMDYRYNKHFAWAVHDGDVFMPAQPPVPSVDEPSSAWLLLAGLGLTSFLMHRRQSAPQGVTCAA